MRDPKDAARFQLNELREDPHSGSLRDTLSRRIARKCTLDQIAQLLQESLDHQQRFTVERDRLQREIDQCQREIGVLAQAARLASYQYGPKRSPESGSDASPSPSS